MVVAQVPAAGTTTERVACLNDSTQTYTLYLPPQYAPGVRRPILLVFDPRGRGTLAAALFQEAAERYGWIIASSDNTRSDGPWTPNARALQAMWPDVRVRYAVDERRIYAAGFSGGATVAWALARTSGLIAGIIETGAPETEITATELPGSIAVFSAAGRLDFNYVPAKRIDARVGRAGHAHRLEFFDGPHAWMGKPAATRAVAWLELIAMRAGLRAEDADTARAIETLLDTPDVFHGDTEAQRKTDEREVERMRAVDAALHQLEAEGDPPFLGAIENGMGLGDLVKAAKRLDYAGESAGRILELAFVQAAVYGPQALVEHQQFDRAAMALQIATHIHPDRPRVWYELAAAHAQAKSKTNAVRALERALALGPLDRAALEADARFWSLRGYAPFSSLLARLGK